MGHQLRFIFGLMPGFLGRQTGWLWLEYSV